MEPIKYISENLPILTSNINNSTILVTNKRKYTPKEHITHVDHYVDDGQYYGSRISYRMSHQYKVMFKVVDIFKDPEYSWLIVPFNNNDTTARGISIEFKKSRPDVNRIHRNKTYSSNTVTIADEIYVELPRPSYTVDFSDKELFRMRDCVFDDTLFLDEVRWKQVQLRNAHYINSVDTTTRFDCNSMYIFLRKESMRKKLHSDIYKLNSNEYGNRNQDANVFVQHLFQYTMWLFYINTYSPEWDYKKITYDNMWNLAMYILAIVKPFDKEEDYMKIKKAYIQFLFQKRVYNACTKGIKRTYLEMSTALEEKVNKNLFVEGTSKLDKAMFREVHKSNARLSREKRINMVKELIDKGISYRDIAKQLNISLPTVLSYSKQ